MNYFMKKTSDLSGEVFVYETIGDSFFGGVSAQRFISDLKALGEVGTIDVRINSEGGNVFDAIAMYQALVRHEATVNVHIDAMAASAASVLAMAGNKIFIAENAFMMIHNPWSIAMGGAEAFRKRAELLDTMRDTIVGTYEARTGQPRTKLVDWMDAETWFNAEDCVKNGFATHMTENMRIAASLNHPEWFKEIPEPIAEMKDSTPELRAANFRIAAMRLATKKALG